MKILNPSTLMKPMGGYSQGVQVGDMVFVAGQTGVDKDMNLGAGIAEQTTQTVRNIGAILAAAGGSLADVVSTTVYLTNFENYTAFDEAYQMAFGDHRPARATVRADLVVSQLLVEIQATAVVRGAT